MQDTKEQVDLKGHIANTYLEIRDTKAKLEQKYHSDGNAQTEPLATEYFYRTLYILESIQAQLLHLETELSQKIDKLEHKSLLNNEDFNKDPRSIKRILNAEVFSVSLLHLISLIGVLAFIILKIFKVI